MSRTFTGLVVALVAGQGTVVGPLLAEGVSGRLATMSVWTAQAVEAARRQLPEPRVRVNRTVPRLTKPTYAVDFGAAPSTEALAAARLFSEPLIPVGGSPSLSDNQALARALELYASAGSRATRAQVLEDFLAAAPASPWRVSIAANVGSVLWREGYFSRAAKYWALAWDTGKSATVPRERAVAEYALGELMMHHMAFGQTELLQAKVDELKEIPIGGSAGSKIETARDGLWILLNRHDKAVFSGPTALLMIMDRLGAPTPASREIVSSYQPSHSGTTLKELSELSGRAGLRLVARRVERASDLQAPYVVHLRSNHYSTVIERKDGSYVLRDPALGGFMQMSEAALQDEMSGFVLVPEKHPEVGQPATEAEMQQVVGHCVPGTPEHDPPCTDESCTPEGPNPDSGGGGPGGPGGEPGGPGGEPGGGPGGDPGGGPGGDPGGGPGGDAGGDAGGDNGGSPKPPKGMTLGEPCPVGMPQYRLHMMSATVKLVDRPCTYRPPIGPAVRLQLRYANRTTRLPQVPSYGHVGPLWSHDWMSWVEDNNTSFAAPYSWENVVVRGDTVEQYNSYSGYTHWRSRATLVKVAHDPPRYERQLRDGTTEVFDVPDRGPAVPGRRVFLRRVIDPQGHEIVLDYDAQFRLRAVTDALGQVSVLDYLDPADDLRLTRMTDPFGRVVNLTYDGNGYLKGITDVVGMESTFGYAPDGFVHRMQTPYGVTGFTRGPDETTLASFRRLEARDPGNAVQRVEYHMSGTTSGMPFSRSSGVPSGFSSMNAGMDVYNSMYWDKRAMAQAPGDPSRATQMHWLIREAMAYSVVGGVNARNMPHSIERPQRPRVWYKYPDQPNYTAAGSSPRPIEVARVIGGGQTQSWKATYNTRGKTTSRIDPQGRETSYVYAPNGIDLLEVRRMTGGGSSVLGAALSNYTAKRRPQTITDAAGRSATLNYNASAQLTTVTNALNQTTTVGYTGAYPTTITGAVSGSTTTLAYDPYGRVRTITASDGYGATIDYDHLNRITKQTYPDGSFEQVVYDKLDVRSFRDRLGRLTLYYYDESRRLKSIRDPLGRVTTFGWCECGTLDSMTDGNGRKTTWEYDNLSRVIREVRADGVTDTTYTYDEAGRLKTVTDPNGQTTVYDYNLDNSLQQVTYQNAGQSTGTITWAYDPVFRRVTTRTDDAGTTTYTYKSAGADGAFDIDTVNGPFTNDTISYGYDELGRRTTRTLGGVSVTQGYDALGRPGTLVSALGNFVPTYVGTTGRLATLTYPNGQATAYTYLPVAQDLRVQTIHHTASGGATLSKFDYTYDVVGNLLTWRQERTGQTPFEYVFTHDAADQLKTATRQTVGGAPTLLGRQLWDYDRGGNRTLAQTDDAIFRTTHDALNRQQQRLPGGAIAVVGTTNEPATVTVAGQPAPSDAGNTFRGSAPTAAGTTTVSVTATDPNGNAATRQYEVDVAGATTTYTFDDNGNLTGDGLKTYVWNARNQLLKVQQGGADLAVFTYDGAGRRVTKTAGGVTRTYIYDGPDILEERVSTGDVIRYVHGPGMDNVLARTTNGANAVYYATDHLGSIVHETNAAGAVTLHREYDAWGELKQGQGTSGFAFTGREWDAETGLYFYRARYYEPTSGRFVGEDPAGYVDGPNLFSYVSGRPTGYRDPMGWCGEEQVETAVLVLAPLAEAAIAAATETLIAGAVLIGSKLFSDWMMADDEASKWEVKGIEKVTGQNIHDIKKDAVGKGVPSDVYKKPNGDFVVKPKPGIGPGTEIGVNVKDLPRR